MPRLRNKVTGAVVNVSDEKAKTLPSEWESADAAPKTRAKKTETPAE